MGKGIAAFLGFICGGTAGLFVGKILLEQHYAQITQEEIDSVKRAFREQTRTTGPIAPKSNEMGSQPSGQLAETKKSTYQSYYREIKNAEPAGETKKEEKKISPYVISPAEFGAVGYEEISLTYYTDGTIADDNDEPMSEEDIAETVGRDSLEHFGEYEPDSVFVRNDDMRTDYEILLDNRSYAKAMEHNAYKAPKQ